MNQVNSLRSALELLRGIDGQLIETDVPVKSSPVFTVMSVRAVL